MSTTRTFSTLNHFILWFGASISIAEIVTGTLLAPLGLVQGLQSILIGHVIGASILMLAGLTGACSGLSATATFRISFGRYGSYVFSVLNMVQLLGWTAVMIICGAKALDGIDLEIEKGKFTAIIGASGSGKTTLLNMIGGMDIPDEGEVIVDGVNLRGLKEKELAVFRRSKVGFVYQNFNLVPTLTVKENILFPLSLAGSTPDPAFFDEIVELLHLKDRLNAYPGELSGGGQQRVAIARALIAKPSILLADEPTGNLDSKTGQNVLGLLKLSVETYRQTLVMITHNLELAQMADRVVRIEDGRIRV